MANAYLISCRDANVDCDFQARRSSLEELVQLCADHGHPRPSSLGPELKRAVRDQAEAFGAKTILIEDKASGTQLIQELVHEGVHAVKQYKPTEEKTMRMHSVTAMIENGFVYLPEKAAWLAEYLHELTSFPNAKYDDQADSTSQALDWFKQSNSKGRLGLIEYYRQEAAKLQAVGGRPISDSPAINRGAALREWDRQRGRFGNR